MKIFVTGASGFIGGAATAHLAKEHTVTAMSRSEASDAAIEALGATPIRCDLDTVDASALEGVDMVIHSAAKVDAWGPMDDFMRANVDGTKRLLDAATQAGVRRFIHIGTEAALFFGQDMVNVDETVPLALDSPFPYSRSKAHAEQAVVAANDPENDFTTIVIRPRFVWGPGDKTLLPAVKAMAEAGQFMWIGGGRNKTSTTYIDNLVHAIELALTKGKGGEAYFILDGPPVTFRPFVTAMADTAGIELGDRSVPGGLVRGAAKFLAFIWRVFGLKGVPPIDPFTASIMSRECTLVGDKAGMGLGYVPVVSREDGLAALRHSLS